MTKSRGGSESFVTPGEVFGRSSAPSFVQATVPRFRVKVIGDFIGGRMLRVGTKKSPYCSRADIFVSRPRSLWEELAILLTLRPVRCHDCMRRFYRSLLTRTPLPPKEHADAEDNHGGNVA